MRDKILLFLLLVLLTLGVYGFLTFFERYEEEIDIGWSLEARQNPHLAAQIFLQENSITVDFDATLQDMSVISKQSTVFIQNADRVIPSMAKIDATLDWAHQGGHLILGASGDTELSSNTIFERFGIDINDFYDEEFEGIQQKPLSEQLKEINELGVNNEDADEAEVIDSFIEIEFNNGERLEVTLPLYKSFELVDRNQVEILQITEDELGISFLQIAYGRGVITFLPDSYLWQSYRIGYLDNAYFLLKLIDSDNFFAISLGQSLSLWELLKRYAYELVTISVLAIIFWLWSSVVRRGRLVPPAPPARRALSEYVMAMSEFFMAGNNHKQLLMAVKKDVFDTLLKKDRQFLNYESQTQAALIVEYCQSGENTVALPSINTDTVLEWLSRFEQEVMDETVFVEQVKFSYTIKKQL